MIFDTLPSRSRLFFAAAAVAALVISAVPRSTAQQQPPEADVFPLYKAAALDPATENIMDSSNVAAVANDTSAKQSKRILFVFPNYRAVSADTQLPPLAWKEKFLVGYSGQLRLFVIHYGWTAGWRVPGEELHSRVWTRQLSLWPVSLPRVPTRFPRGTSEPLLDSLRCRNNLLAILHDETLCN
jgi:hypothetical protein